MRTTGYIVALVLFLLAFLAIAVVALNNYFDRKKFEKAHGIKWDHLNTSYLIVFLTYFVGSAAVIIALIYRMYNVI